jgi:hypothetical protein
MPHKLALHAAAVLLKENNWTFIVSTWPAQQNFDSNDKTAVMGIVQLMAITWDKVLASVPFKIGT